MQGVIYLKALRGLLDPPDKTIPRRNFDITYCQLDGTVVGAKNVVCTSSEFRNDTINILFPESNEVRTVHASLLLKVSGKEVII